MFSFLFGSIYHYICIDMLINKSKTIVFGLLLVFLLGACASGNKRNGTLKKGKPIPCPQKDC